MNPVLDTTKIHNRSKIKEPFRNVGPKGSVEVTAMSTRAAKHISLLDNALFHDWKDRLGQHSLLTEKRLVTTMNNEWYNTKEESIKH